MKMTSIAAVVAAALTALTCLLFHWRLPGYPLNPTGISLVFSAYFVVALGAIGLWRRFAKKNNPEKK